MKTRLTFVVSVLVATSSGIIIAVGLLMGFVTLVDFFTNIFSVLVYAFLTALGTTTLLIVTGRWKQKAQEKEPEDSKLIIVPSGVSQVEEVLVRFPAKNGKEIERRHEVRFYYITIRNDGKKTVDDVVIDCLANEMLIIPSTSKPVFGIDVGPFEQGGVSVEEYDEREVDNTITVLLRDRNKVKESIEYIHPKHAETFVLFFTVKGITDRFFVPAYTKVWFNAYGGAHNSIIRNMERKATKVWIKITARDIKPLDAEFEVTLHDWNSFDVKLMQPVYE